MDLYAVKLNTNHINNYVRTPNLGIKIFFFSFTLDLESTLNLVV